MSITSEVHKLLANFEKENPTLQGKAYLTSGERTWEEQLDIILDPKRKKNYIGIKDRYKQKFKVKELPAKRAELGTKELAWWKVEIMKQAGQSPGFPHVGGKAQDISVKNLSLTEKEKLKTFIEKEFKILMERVTGDDSQYGVSVENANVFHIYK